MRSAMANRDTKDRRSSVDERIRQTATLLLARIDEGDERAEEELFELIHADLHAQAARLPDGSPAPQATDLVHAAYERLFQDGSGRWENRRHYLRVSAHALRAILVDHARAGRSSPGREDPIDRLVAEFERRFVGILPLDESLRALEQEDPRAASVVELRLFAGLTLGEVAGVLRYPMRTIERDWTFARIRLRGSIR